MEEKYDIILNTIEDLVSDFLYYDRKEDEDLQVGDIEKAVNDGIISVEEIISCFSNKLKNSIKN